MKYASCKIFLNRSISTKDVPIIDILALREFEGFPVVLDERDEPPVFCGEAEVFDFFTGIEAIIIMVYGRDATLLRFLLNSRARWAEKVLRRGSIDVDDATLQLFAFFVELEARRSGN